MDNFIDELLLEVEAQERKLELAQVDAILMEIARLQSEIKNNFRQAEEEKKIIDDWAISRNANIQERSMVYPIGWTVFRLNLRWINIINYTNNNSFNNILQQAFYSLMPDEASDNYKN